MKANDLLEAIGKIDSRFIDNAAKAKTSVINRKSLAIIIAAAGALIVAASVIIVAMQEPKAIETRETTLVLEPTEVGADTNDFAINSSSVIYRGTGFSEEEIYNLIYEDQDFIASAIAYEYDCFGQELRIFLDGFNHVTFGEENVIDRDFLTLPVCLNNEVVGFVELFKVDGEITYSLRLGGETWNNINEALNYGEVSFAYLGFGELAIAPDNRVFDITTGASSLLSDDVDWYSVIHTDSNSYSAENFDVEYDRNNGVMDTETFECPPYISVFALDSIYVDECRNLISEGELETVTNLDNPIVRYQSMPGNIEYFRTVDEDYEILLGDDEYCYSVTFTTTADAVLGPITYYIDMNGTIFGSAYRE